MGQSYFGFCRQSGYFSFCPEHWYSANVLPRRVSSSQHSVSISTPGSLDSATANPQPSASSSGFPPSSGTFSDSQEPQATATTTPSPSNNESRLDRTNKIIAIVVSVPGLLLAVLAVYYARKMYKRDPE
jgi:hypothetical protein